MEAQWEAVPFQEERMSRGAALDSSDSGVPFRLPHSLLREALVPLGHFAYMFPQRLVEEVPDVLQTGDEGEVCHGADTGSTPCCVNAIRRIITAAPLGNRTLAIAPHRNATNGASPRSAIRRRRLVMA